MTQFKLFVSNAEAAEYDVQLAQAAQLSERDRIDTIITLAWSLRQRDCRRALLLAEQAQTLLFETQISSLARLHLIRAEVHWLFANLSEAEQSLAFALELFEQSGDQLGMADAYLLQAVYFPRFRFCAKTQ